MLHNLVKFRFLPPEGCIIAKTVSKQQVSCNIETVTDMFRVVCIASDCDDFSTCIFVYLQDIRMWMREGESTV